MATTSKKKTVSTKKKTVSKTTPDKPKMGRPTKFNESLKGVMIRLYEQGKTDAQVAEIVGVCPKTIENWKSGKPDFLLTLKEMKNVADKLVEASLFERAVGYSTPEEKVFCSEGEIITHDTIKQYPPDVTAGIFWLKNRQPKEWREKQPGEDDATITVNLGDKLNKARERAKKAKK